MLHQDGLPAIVSLDEHSRVSHLARERNAASRADAGILAMWISDGRKGVSHLLRQATRVKVSAFWWVFALLTPQIWFTAAAVLYLLLQGSPIVLKPTALLALGTPALLVTFLFGPLGEEFGWRGFLLPRLIQRFSVLAACFLVGIVWAVWHWPLFWKNIFKSPGHELFFLFANVTGLCFLICAVYLGSRSLLLAMMTHWSSNAARAIVGKLLPGLPANAADTSTWRWCVFGVLALIVAGTIPVLLRVDRQAQRNARAAAR